MPAQDPLHIGVDLKKPERCGVGPGLPFATSLIQMGDHHIQGIGLIPSAIGGSCLDEWAPQYDPVTAPPSPYTDNVHPKYLSHQQSQNLYAATIRRTRLALASAPPGSQLRGLVWYQGETDAMDETATSTYTTRFLTMVESFRSDLSIPHLPVLAVAITSTTAKLTQLVKIRQVLLDLPHQVPHLAVIDSFGLGLASDGLHLTTWSQYELGRRLAITALAVGIIGRGASHGPWTSVMDYLPSLLTDGPEELKQGEDKLQTW